MDSIPILYRYALNFSASIQKTENKDRRFSYTHREGDNNVLFDGKSFKKKQFYFTFLISVPLGSVPELPAESCAEIRASEGEGAVSGNYWFDSIKPGDVVLARSDVSKQGN